MQTPPPEVMADLAMRRAAQIEGRLLALRDALISVITHMPATTQREIAQTWSMQFADTLAALTSPAPGQDQHPADPANRALGYKAEWSRMQQHLLETSR